MGYIALATLEWGISPDVTWELSPQEWWEFWSYKYGKRKIKMELGLNDDVVISMAERLDEELAKEGRTRG